MYISLFEHDIRPSLFVSYGDVQIYESKFFRTGFSGPVFGMEMATLLFDQLDMTFKKL